MTDCPTDGAPVAPHPQGMDAPPKIPAPYARRIPDIDELPLELTEREVWVVYRLEQRPGKPKPDKVPVSAVTGSSSGWSDNPAFATSFERAFQYAHSKKLHGLGVLLTPGCGVGGIDLDRCRDPDTGDLSELARSIMSEADTYFEVSPGLSGVRGFFLGGFGGHTGNDQTLGIELYESRRFLTVTGDHIDSTPFAVEPRDLTELGRRYFPDKGTAHPVDADAARDFVSVDLSRFRLSQHTLKVIRTGDTARYGGDRSRALFAMAKDLAKAGLPQVEVARVLVDPKHGISAKPLEERRGDLTSAMDWLLKYTIPAAFKEVRAETDTPTVREEPSRAQVGEPAPNDWPDPSDIRSPTPAANYPTECFPEIARQAIEECAAYRRVPAVMPAQSALFQMSLATQGLANVARDSRLVGPISTNTLLFLESGGRKTAVDSDFGNGYKLWVRAMRKEKLDEHRRSIDEVAAYEAKRKGLLSDIKGCSGKADEKSRAELNRLQEELIELGKNPPAVIPLPADLVEEFNRAALSNILAKGWPSTGTVSNEAGILVGSQGFNKENATGTFGLLNRVWDGADYIEARKTVDAAHIRGRRFCCHLAMQPHLLNTLVERGARDIGFLARFLIARPDKVMGDRLYQEPPEHWPAMQKFDAAITRLLSLELPIDREQEDAGAEMRLKPPAMRLSADAKRAWIDYHDDVERELCKFGEYEAVSDVASKSAENAARIAAIFQIFDKGGTAAEVEAGYMESAISVARWHLYEARRLFLDIDTPENQLDARELSSWLCGHARTLQRRDGQPLIDQRGMIPIVDILHSGPNRVRTTLRRDAALDILIEAGHVRRCDIGKKRLIEINPKLLNHK